MDEPNPKPRRFEPWPWILVGLLGLMISGSLTFFAIASANPDPLVVEDVWEAGLRYNATLADRERARELGVVLELEAARGPDGVAVRVRLTPSNTTAQSVRIRRERPSQGGFDADFPLTWDGEQWSGQVPIPLQGRWHLTATANVDDAPLKARTSWWQPLEPAS